MNELCRPGVIGRARDNKTGDYKEDLHADPAKPRDSRQALVEPGQMEKCDEDGGNKAYDINPVNVRITSWRRAYGQVATAVRTGVVEAASF